ISKQDRKQLKQEAQAISRQNKVPSKQLVQLAEVNNIHTMLLHVAALLLKQEMKDEEATATSLSVSLNSKDFELMLKAHLIVCLLSLNITAYVTDAHTQLMVSMF
ncbi:hypothetical protein PAXRUDRAFT_38833, partial [Paxillus rubicundulus Ve08.2h10]